MSFRLSELAEQTGAELAGDPDCAIDSVAPLDNARPGSISFLSGDRYRRHLKTTRASAVILAREALEGCPVSALVSTNPYLLYARVAELLHPSPAAPFGVHASAVLEPGCEVHPTAAIGPQCVIGTGTAIGEHVSLGPGCIVGDNCIIGRGSRLIARVTVCHDTVIGERAIIHPGAVIGSDGFGLASDNGAWVKIPQLGRVVVGNDVEIGANTTVDRGALEDTVLEDGVKLDNQVQIAHNVRIGAHTAIAGCVGIAGSAKIGRHCEIGGAAGIQGHLEICDHVTITGMAKVSKSITQPGVYSSGTPLEPNAQWLKNSVRFRHLDDIMRRLRALEKKR